MLYGSFHNTFSGLCYVRNGEISCMTPKETNDAIGAVACIALLIYLIWYRIQH